MPSDKPWSEGPWEVDYTGQTVVSSSGTHVAFAATSVTVGEGQAIRVDKAEAKANARLIAAAPELVEALRDIRDGLEEYTTHGEPPDVDDLLEEFDANHGGLLARVEGGGEDE